MVLDADEYVRQWREDSRGIDLDAIMQSYCDGYADYEGENFYSDDEDEMSTMPVESVMKDAKILADEKKNLDMSGASLDTQSNICQNTGDEEKVKMDIEGGASEDNKATEGKKKEKRKLQEDGVESEQKDGIEIAIQVEKKKDSISKTDD
ncbi:hypothetical protein C5167_037051 [Papaver somniferum]|uniref:Uncharacterized protein n=1 Tax=Papaver somniferum TaxID=3469 RepID=A0A4Y7I5C5_PAPSO|nr:uncharacterized protein LOC113283492 [Papaver somniferum]RZC44107.1 hypothetical protein C5167_037051 [Papaver somniferum]